MNNLLNQLRLVISKYEEIERINGTNFNIFSILNMERKEVQTHSNFIYELLDKNGSHGKGSLFLNLFLTEVLKLEDDGNVENIKVIQEDVTLEKRRIDFTIETSAYQIGIEMKIDADDQPHQLYDYYQELNNRTKENQKIELYYLTLDGKIPSDKSIEKYDKKLTENNYKLISFKMHIIQWIEKSIKECATSTIVREALVQYLNIIKKLTNQSNSKGAIMEMVNTLSNGKNLKTYLQAKDAVIEAKIKLQLSFWNNLKSKLEQTDYKFEFETNYNQDNLEDAVKKYYTEKQKNKGYGLTYHFDNEEDIYYSVWVDERLCYIIGSEKNNSDFKKIKDNMQYLKYSKEDKYTGWNFFNQEFDFNNLLNTPKVFDIFNENKSNNITDEITAEIVKTIEEMKNILKI